MVRQDRDPVRSDQFLDGGGELGELISALHWTDTALGSIESWPSAMTNLLSFVLRSPVPIVTLWG